MDYSCDVAIVGSGFAGSLLAMMARRCGRTVVMLERMRHPRFVIGESSTPLGNLLLEELSDRFDLPAVRSFSKWGTWRRAHPTVSCGLKRGFTFLHHRVDHSWEAAPDRGDQLLVAASPRDEVADTHWYRPEFDAFLAGEAERLGATHLQEVELEEAVFDEEGGTLRGRQAGCAVTVRARLVIDGSGPRGFLARALGLPERPMEHLPPTQSLYTHFRGVGRLEDLVGAGGGGGGDGGAAGGEAPPYPIDDAAVHHVFAGGWIWVLRFDNGIVSAGVAARDDSADEIGLREGAAGWGRLLDRLPLVRAQFAAAEPVRPFVYSPRLAFRAGRVCGPRWALLPYAAGFIDPLLSTGFPLTLLGLGRLGRVLEADWEREGFEGPLQDYARQVTAEFEAAERLIAALYACLDDFPLFARLTLLYFAAATYAETARRLGRASMARGFLLHDHPTFGPALRRLCERAVRLGATGGRREEARTALWAGVLEAIRPIDVAGLTREDRRGWYPVDLGDLWAARDKLGVTEAELREMLGRCGLLER